MGAGGRWSDIKEVWCVQLGQASFLLVGKWKVFSKIMGGKNKDVARQLGKLPDKLDKKREGS